MFKNMFGSKKQEEVKAPEPKKLWEMDKTEQRDQKKAFVKSLNKETREIDKMIYKIDTEKKKAETSLKAEIKKGAKGDKYTKQTYARQIAQSNKMKERYMLNKTKIQSVQYSIDTYFAGIKMGQVMAQSAEIMQTINSCVNVKEMNKVIVDINNLIVQAMMDMSREMEKMGMIGEMIEDALDSVDDQDMDADSEVDNIILKMEQEVQQPKLSQKNNNNVVGQQLVHEQVEEEDDFDKQLEGLKG